MSDDSEVYCTTCGAVNEVPAGACSRITCAKCKAIIRTCEG